jgi:hypothetical protein
VLVRPLTAPQKSTKKPPTHAWLAIKPNHMLSCIGDEGRVATLAPFPPLGPLLYQGAEKMLPRFFLHLADRHTNGTGQQYTSLNTR